MEKYTQPPQSGEQTVRRVLVVDDNMDWVTSLAMTLKIMGHEVRTALNGGSALQTGEAPARHGLHAPDRARRGDRLRAR
jgi:DNA-binding NtrC family response regulator